MTTERSPLPDPYPSIDAATAMKIAKELDRQLDDYPRLCAERDRLREALEKIEARCSGETFVLAKGICRVARKALAGGRGS